MISNIMRRFDKRIPIMVVAGAIAAILLLLPGSALGVTTGVTAAKSDYLLGEMVKFSGQIDFAAGETKTIDSVTFTVTGNQGVTQILPVNPGTYTYPTTNVSAVVTWTNIGAADGYGYAGGYMALGSSVGSINYAIEWDAPILLDPAPNYSLVPNTVVEFDVPTVTAPTLPDGLPDQLPVLTTGFDLPALAAVDPNAPDPMPTMTALANAIPLGTAAVQGAPADLTNNGDITDLVAAIPTVNDDIIAGVAEMPSSTSLVTGITGLIDIDVDSSNNIYVLTNTASSGTDTVRKYDSSGAIVSAFGTSGVLDVTDGSNNVTDATAIAVSNGFIFVSHQGNDVPRENGNKNPLVKIAVDGTSPTTCRTNNQGPHEIVWSQLGAVQGTTYIWAISADDNSIQRFDTDTSCGNNGLSRSKSSGLNYSAPEGITGNATTSYVLPSNGEITTIGSNNPQDLETSIGTVTGYTSSVVGLAIDGDGVFYVAESSNGTISKAQPASTITTSPRGLAYDSTNSHFYLLVNGNGGNDRLLVLDTAGAVVSGKSSIDTGTTEAESVTYLDGSIYLNFTQNNDPKYKAYSISGSSWASAKSAPYEWGGTAYTGAASNGTLLFGFGDNESFSTWETDANAAGDEDEKGTCNSCQVLDSGSSAASYYSAKSQYWVAKNDDIGIITTIENNASEDAVYESLTYDSSSIKIKGMTIVGSVIYMADDQGDRIIKASIPTGETTNPTAITNDGTNLWVVTNGTAGSDSLLKLNLATGAKVANYTLSRGDIEGLTYLGNYLWALGSAQDGGCKVQKIDPSNGTNVGSALTLGQWCDSASGLSNDGTYLAVTYSSQGRIITYDTNGNQETESHIQNASGARGIAFRNSQYWLGKNDDMAAYAPGCCGMDEVSGTGQSNLTGNTNSALAIKGMTWDGDILYIVDDTTDYIYKTAPPTGSNNILGMTDDGTDLYILVNNTPNDSIMKVSASGTKDSTWGTAGVVDTDSDNATAITVIGNNLWVGTNEQDMGPPKVKFYSYAVSNGSSVSNCEINNMPTEIRGLGSDGTNLVWGGSNMMMGALIYDTNCNSQSSFNLSSTNSLSGMEVRSTDPQILATSTNTLKTFSSTGSLYDTYNLNVNNITGVTAIGHVVYIGEADGNTVKKAAIPLPTSTITTEPKGMTTDGTDFYLVIEASPKDYIAKVDSSGQFKTDFSDDGYVQAPNDGVGGITYMGGALYTVHLQESCQGMQCDQQAVVTKLNKDTGASEATYELPAACQQGPCYQEANGIANADGEIFVSVEEGGGYAMQPSIFTVDLNNPGNADHSNLNGSNSSNSMVFIGDDLYSFSGNVMKRYEEQYGNFQLENSGGMNGVTEVGGVTYLGTTMYLADISGVVKGTTLPTNIPELTIVGSYASTLTAVADSTSVTSSASNFTVGKIQSTDIAVTSPLTGFSVFTPNITIEGTVNDPAVDTVSVGVDLPFTELFTDSAEDGSTSTAKFTKTGLWNIACDDDVPGDAKTKTGDCAWYYGNQQNMNYDTGNNSGTLQIASDLNVVSEDIQFSFSTWWDTEPGVQYDRKLVEIKESGGAWTTVAAILGPYDLDENGQPFDVPGQLSSVSQWLGVPQAKMQGPGMTGCPPYCEPGNNPPNPGPGPGPGPGPQSGQPMMETVSVNLAPYNGKTISIRFKFDTMDAYVNAMEGWWIDDIEIGGAGFLGVTSSVTPVTDTTQNNAGVYGSYSVVFALAEGINTIKVNSQNPYDATLTSSKEISGFLDTTPPTITMTELTSPTKAPTATVAGEIGDVNFQELTITQTTSLGTKTIVTVKTLPQDGLFSKVAGLVEGTNTFTATAKDGAGLTASASVAVVLDTVGPVLTINTPSYPIGAVSARQGEPVIFSVDAEATGAPVDRIEVVFPGNAGTSRFKTSAQVPEAIRDLWNITGGYMAPTKIPDNASPGQYSLTINAYDTAGNVTSDTVAASVVASLEGYNVNLMPNWNLVSLPLMPDSGDIATLTTNTTGIQSIWYYDATKTLATGETETDRWLVYTPSTLDVDTLTTLQTGRGYWFKMDPDAFTLSSPLGPGLPHTPQAIKMTYSGQFVEPGTLPPSYEVVEGWNAMGFHSENELPVTTALQSLESPQRIWGSLLQYNNRIVFTIPDKIGEEPEFEILLGAFQRLLSTENMTPGYGYWIFMVDDGVITP